MRFALALLVVVAIVAVLAARALWTGREPAQPQVTSRSTQPPRRPSGDAPPPGSRPDRERKGKL